MGKGRNKRLMRRVASVVTIVGIMGAITGLVLASGVAGGWGKGWGQSKEKPKNYTLSAPNLSLLGDTSTTTSTAETAAGPALSGAIFTTLEDGSRVNANLYPDKRDVYLDGGPPRNAPSTSAGLPAGNYYFQVTDPSGKKLLSTDPVLCREVEVNAAGVISAYLGDGRTYPGKGNKVVDCNKDGRKSGLHDTGVDIDHASAGAITVQLMPYADTPNRGGVYKVWLTPVADLQGDPSHVDNSCGSGCFHGFVPARSKTDNFKVRKGKGGNEVAAPRVEIVKWYDFDLDGVEEVGVAPSEVYLTGWQVNVTDPLGVTNAYFTPVTIDPADEGTYVICESTPLQGGWVATTPLCQQTNVSNGETRTIEFGNAYYAPFPGGLTIGYWKTHTGLDSPPRDDTYDLLPVVLGVASNGIMAPEMIVFNEAIAQMVLVDATCSGDCVTQLKAQLVAAKLNVLKFPGFGGSVVGIGGPTVQSVIDAADQLLDDVAAGAVSGEAAIKAIAEPLKTQLDQINNNGHTPVLFAVSVTPGPYGF